MKLWCWYFLLLLFPPGVTFVAGYFFHPVIVYMMILSPVITYIASIIMIYRSKITRRKSCLAINAMILSAIFYWQFILFVRT